MRVVLDTNVVVSALLWGGTPFKLLQAATESDIELFTSPALLEELREVLAREHLTERVARLRGSVDQAIVAYSELAVFVSPLATPRVVPNDVDDDHVVAAAVAARAELLVTGDSDLLSLGSFGNLAIVTAAQAVQKIAA